MGARDGAQEVALTDLIAMLRSGRGSQIKPAMITETTINHADEAGWTVLHHAVAQEELRVIRLLLNAGANPESVDRAGHSPLSYAEMDNLKGISRLLRS